MMTKHAERIKSRPTRMFKIFAIGSLLIFVRGTAMCAVEKQPTFADATTRLELLKKTVERDEIGTMEVVCAPESLMGESPTTPVALERGYFMKVTVSDVRRLPFAADARQALSSLVISAASRDQKPDVRYGAILYDVKGYQTFRVFADAAGSSGTIDGTIVNIRGGFFNWLKNQFAPCSQRTASQGPASGKR